MKVTVYSNRTGRRIGYARVSTGEQDTDAQVMVLKAAGCSMIFQDIASGSNRDRPQLARALKIVGAGDTLIVARLARSLVSAKLRPFRQRNSRA